MGLSKKTIQSGGLLLVLALGTAWLYLPVRGFDFVNFDDGQYVLDNPHIQQGITVRGLSWALTSGYAANWHPLTWMSHMLDCQLYGLQAAGHHQSSALLHVANSLLLFGLLRRLTGAQWRSAIVAALFAWHPMHVESVAWVSERKDVLSTFFGLLTLWAYTAYVSRPSGLRYGRTLLLFLCGLLCKPMLVSLPLLLLLLDYWPLGRILSRPQSGPFRWLPERLLTGWSWLVLEKIPFFLLAAGCCGVTLVAQLSARSQLSQRVAFLGRIANALNSYARYCGKLIWPQDLSVFYPYQFNLPLLWVFSVAVTLVAVSAGVWLCRRRYPYLGVGWGWFLITLVPVIGVVKVGGQAMADRYSYIPSIGFFVAVVWGGVQLTQRWKSARWFLVGITVLALTGCLTVAARQLQYWHDSVSLFSHAVAINPRNAVAQCALGQALFAHRQDREALEHLDAALRVVPSYSLALSCKGDILCREGHMSAALVELERAVKADPNYDTMHRSLARALKKQGREAEAERQYREAIRCDPTAGENHLELGAILAGQNRLEEAIAQYRIALALASDAAAENALGSALQQQGKDNEALEHYAAAVRLKPGMAQAQCNLGAILFERGQMAEAAQYFLRALKAQPDLAEAHYNLGDVLVRQGRFDDAEEHYTEAVRLKPDYADAHFNLANVFAQKQQWQSAVEHYNAAARLLPDFFEVQLQLALVLQKTGNDEQAVEHYRNALRQEPTNLRAQEGLARLLATTPDSRIRNGAEAVRLATQASRDQTPEAWDTLAAACAEAGQFKEALHAITNSIRLANEAGRLDLTLQLTNRLHLYQAGQPFHEERASDGSKSDVDGAK
jgi:protein O-mannosyl-transferase